MCFFPGDNLGISWEKNQKKILQNHWGFIPNSSIHCHCYDCDEHFEHMAASFVLVSAQQCGGWVYSVTPPMGCLGMIVSDTSSCSISERMVWNCSWRHVVFVSMLCSWFFNWCFERQTLNAMLPMEKKLWCQSECFLLERFVLESWLTDRYEAFQRHHQKASFCRIQKSMHVGKVKYGRTVDVSRFQVSAVLTWEVVSVSMSVSVASCTFNKMHPCI